MAITLLVSVADKSDEYLRAISARINASGALPAVTAAIKLDHSHMQHMAPTLLAATLLAFLSGHSDPNKDAIIAAGALSILATLISSEQASPCIAAATALSSLMEGSQSNRDAVIATGAIPMLQAVLVILQLVQLPTRQPSLRKVLCLL